MLRCSLYTSVKLRTETLDGPWMEMELQKHGHGGHPTIIRQRRATPRLCYNCIQSHATRSVSLVILSARYCWSHSCAGPSVTAVFGMVSSKESTILPGRIQSRRPIYSTHPCG